MCLRIGLAGWLIVSFVSGVALAGDGRREHSPEMLGKLLARVSEEVAQGQRPIAIFDLDDTLFDSRTRTLRILRELANSALFCSQHSEEAHRIRTLKLKDIGYSVDDVIRQIGISDPVLFQEIHQYWASRLFSDDESALDRPIRGAARFTRAFVRRGGTVIYLTGRDEAHMGIGTTFALLKRRFPFGDHAKLVMRPDNATNELEFKKRIFVLEKTEGHVIAGFENEPRNVNAMHEEFPDGLMFFLDTIHSKNPDQVEAGIFWLKDFRFTAER